MKNILVLGGSGFIGRQVCEQLNRAGWRATVPTRRAIQAQAVQTLPCVTVVEADIHDEATLRRLLPGMVIGTVLGLWLTHHLSSRWPLLALGVYVAGVGVRALRAGASHRPLPERWGMVYGLGVGVVEMLFGTAGPVVVAWLTRRLPDPHQVRATIPMVMAVAVLTVLGGMALDGRLSQPVLWQRWLLLIVPALAGVWLGHRLAHRVPVARLRQTICALLVVSGSVLATKALG